MNAADIISGYPINEYRLLIPLSESLQEKVLSIKALLYKKQKIPLPFELPPSLTILRFQAFEQSELKVIDFLQRTMLATKPFLVEFEDFAAYPSHTIYINLKTKSPFHELSKNLKKGKKHFNLPDHAPHFINEPHLILAQRLKPGDFSSMWKECEQNQFTGKYICDHVKIFKRSPSVRKYKELRKIELQNLPQNLKQGALFSG